MDEFDTIDNPDVPGSEAKRSFLLLPHFRVPGANWVRVKRTYGAFYTALATQVPNNLISL